MKRMCAMCGIFAALLVTACSSAPKVTRMDSSTVTDLSGNWNDTDRRTVCASLVHACVTSPRVVKAISEMKRTPRVVVGIFRNKSSDHMDTEILSRLMEEAIFNDGTFDFVAGGETREQLRSERADQDSTGAAEGTGNELLKEIGADYLMTGTVYTEVDKAANKTVKAYTVTAELTNIRTNERVWLASDDSIKKEIVQPKNKL